jgi:Cu/Ag efflux protein CusF
MKSLSIAIALAAVTLAAAPASSFAQETKTARGTVSIVADDSLTIKMPGQEMKFAVDAKTTVEVVGGGTRTRQAQQAGQPGPKLTEVLKVGQPVTVSYTEANGVMHASSVRAIASVGRAAEGKDRGGATPAAAAKSMSGLVTVVGPSSLIIMGSGGASQTFTFSVDGSTKVIGVGAGTAAAAAGGKTAVTDLVKRGDKVSVSYHQMGGTLHAAEIRVTAKGAAK